MTNNHNPPNLSASLDSSNIREAVFDPFMKVLTLRFKTGGDYQYIGVEQEVYDGLIKAKSAGRYFHANIRNKYEFLKVTRRETADEEREDI